MNYTKNVYCRLCAELKPHSELTNLQTDEETCQKVVNKLSRFNIMMDFQENALPKTVCILCVNSLERAFSFVTAVEQAQLFLNDYILVQERTEKSDTYGEFDFYVPTDVGKDILNIKVESRRDPVDVSDNDPNFGDECDEQNDDSVDGEASGIETKDLTKSYVFVEDKPNIKDENDESNVNYLKDNSLNFSNDCLEYQYTNVIENDLKVQVSSTKPSELEEKVVTDIKHNPNSEEDRNKLNHRTDNANKHISHKLAFNLVPEENKSGISTMDDWNHKMIQQKSQRVSNKSKKDRMSSKESDEN
ncbi:hypothetical protein PYW07_011603 [Mythimna separata]|uniref:ZAD domain-containing protein n=1 Tax=Mythimna separata TaxID=271217 RepID=A0AAD7Y6J0_MYTSE|nr:hypothetical protein PYW07_011603 [Mythimna separata]